MALPKTAEDTQPCLIKAHNGTCFRGSGCVYAASHAWDPAILQERSVCTKFRTGRGCAKGDKCPWVHKIVPCIRFEKGKCSEGNKCRYAHIKSNSPPAGQAADNNTKPKGSQQRKSNDPSTAARGISAYKRGDYDAAISVFDKALDGVLDQGIRISLTSNRAHAYEKLSLLKKDPSLLERALEDCDRVERLMGPQGHFKTTLLRARILVAHEKFDEAIRAAKQAAQTAQGNDDTVKAMELLDCIMAAKMVARQKADEAALALQRAAEENARIQRILNDFASRDSHEILGVAHSATPSEIETAFQKLAVKYRPPRSQGDEWIFQKIQGAFRELAQDSR